MDHAIEVHDLFVERGGKAVLRGITTAVRKGSITGLLGPSGSGKSTLMRAIVGVQVVKSGHILVCGEPAGSPVLRRKVGYVTQSPSIYADLTVRENVRYFASLYGLGKEAVVEVIQSVGLSEQADQLVGTLSGGQRGRASLACALVAAPEILVLDEPTVGLDPVLRDELWAHFRKLAENGVTLLVSSHVMDEANRCDRLILIRDGEIIADDTPDGVKARAGVDDLDAAFLALIRAKMEVA